jgi:hypothetical protein
LALHQELVDYNRILKVKTAIKAHGGIFHRLFPHIAAKGILDA